MRCSSSLLIAVGGLLFGVPQVNAAQLDGPGGALLADAVAVVVGSGGGSLIGSGEAVVVTGIPPSYRKKQPMQISVPNGLHFGHCGGFVWAQ
jgi:hypothetical protein